MEKLIPNYFIIEEATEEKGETWQRLSNGSWKASRDMEHHESKGAGGTRHL